jgi:hypothetical protein
MFNEPRIYRQAGHFAALFERIGRPDSADDERAFFRTMRAYESTDADRATADAEFTAGQTNQEDES